MPDNHNGQTYCYFVICFAFIVNPFVARKNSEKNLLDQHLKPVEVILTEVEKVFLISHLLGTQADSFFDGYIAPAS